MKSKKEKDMEFYTYRGYEMLRQENIQLTPSMEDYLEMIYRTCEIHGYTRMTNLAEQLNVQVPSATKTVQKLAGMDLLAYEKYGIIQLTEKGAELGEFLLKRHRIVEAFLKNLGVKDDLLRQTEMIEHHLTVNTVQNMDMFNMFFKQNPKTHQQFLEYQRNFQTD